MDSRSQALARVTEQLAQQNSQWQGVQSLLESFGARTLLSVDETLLAEIDSACSAEVTFASASPAHGLRG